MSENNLPMDPMMEAFFVAVALELGTKPLPLHLEKRNELGLPLTTEEAAKLWNFTVEKQDIAAYMQDHPGSPEILVKLRRMQREAGGGLAKHMADDFYFWSQLAEAYVAWCRATQPDAE